MNNAHHWGWMVVVLVGLGVVTYIFTLNRPDVQKGGYHGELHQENWPLSIHIGEGGCARLDSTKGLQDALVNKNSH